MGLLIDSLEHIPISAHRDYFIYLLDYGWHEPISDALRDNFMNMADKAATNKAVIIRGTSVGFHFENEVMSWHHINNEESDDLLPALLITNAHPVYFRDNNHKRKDNTDLKLILIPFKRICKSTTEVITIIEKVFKDIEAQMDLNDFKIAKELKKGIGRAIVDSIILEPNVSGIGFSFNKLINYLKDK